MNNNKELPEIIIPKEQAVFWMDRLGRWHNEGGRFEHKRIIDYFNASICKDEQGYFVVQNREFVREKVYFFYEDTPLFVVDVRIDRCIELILNTGTTLPMVYEDLFVSKDTLYIRKEGERIRFTDRAMIQLASHLDYEDGKYCYLEAGVRHFLPEQ
jgi:hypothetical protein